MARFAAAVENDIFDEAYRYVARSDSAEVWRQLAGLCVRSGGRPGYATLLKTCVSHLRSPMVSLVIRAGADGGVSADAETTAALAVCLSE